MKPIIRFKRPNVLWFFALFVSNFQFRSTSPLDLYQVSKQNILLTKHISHRDVVLGGRGVNEILQA